MSPKAGAPLELTAGDELKLVFPQPAAMPELFEKLDFSHFFIQPMDGPVQAENTRLAIGFCLKNPKWRLSVQTHKLLNIP
jgi:7-carboxy-7-deazaguanine synthase